jgi:hypothetical protein
MALAREAQSSARLERAMIPSTATATGLQTLIDKAQSDLFASVAPEQRARLAEAWSRFRQGAALLAEAEHGRISAERLREAIDHAQAAIQALLVLADAAAYPIIRR